MRTLKATEIELKVQMITKTSKGSVGCLLVPYKDARVDMKLLDETYGEKNWQRTHEEISNSLFCNIDVWDNEKKQWVRKQDVGVESFTEKEKGEASDSFKRAGVNWGIGRELYTSPFIWIPLNENEYTVKEKNEKETLTLKKNINFTVHSIAYTLDREIMAIKIMDQDQKIRYELTEEQYWADREGRNISKERASKEQIEALEKAIKDNLEFLSVDMVTEAYGVKTLSDLTKGQAKGAMNQIDHMREEYFKSKKERVNK